MVTIQEVAEKAGVAPITVSRVLNNSGYVSARTRARVETVAAELNYVPNSLARSLRSNRTNILALLLGDIANPFWTTMARGVEDVANRQGFSVILCNTDEKESKQAEYLAVLLRKRVDGFLLIPTAAASEPVQTIQRQKIPVVVIDRTTTQAHVDSVRGDSFGGAYQLTQHLLALGHRRIAVLSGPAAVSTAVERVAGVAKALQEVGAPLPKERIVYGEYSLASGYAMTAQVLTTQPTAIVAANNFIAIGVGRYLREKAIYVPNDISVVSFDDVPISWDCEPSLTVAVQPAYDLGRCATELLLKRINGAGSPTYEEIMAQQEFRGLTRKWWLS